MSGGEGRKLSNQDIQLVKNRIEQCLQQYMNKKEVINDLIVQGNVEPCITELGIVIWLRLVYAYVYLVAPNCVFYNSL
ncbi:hypothetical protein SASPL_138127 [Salvia splendens]|uniref:Uncharacterized protein n=1 Tax=Salvia splendens TaxID=180675 RepID=A0A8X8ZDU5_SALSN|nr:hypothetical protein SASPL_138127 [Salvia splendens]